MKFAIGVDVGGTKTAAALVSSGGRQVRTLVVPTPAGSGPEAVLDSIAALVANLCTDRFDEIVGIGIGTAGAVKDGCIVSATDTFAHWAGTDVALGVRSRIGLHDRPVVVRNDVDAHAVGEFWVGAASGANSMLMIAVGTGVGGAIILDGRLWTGTRGIAGEVGHIPARDATGMMCTCGREGHIEALSSGPAIARRFAERTGESISTREVMRRAAEGEVDAQAVVTEAAGGLGRVIAGLVTTLDPAVVVIGGGVAAAQSPWWETSLESALRSELVDGLSEVRLLRSQLGGDAPILGAAHEAFVAAGVRLEESAS